MFGSTEDAFAWGGSLVDNNPFDTLATAFLHTPLNTSNDAFKPTSMDFSSDATIEASTAIKSLLMNPSPPTSLSTSPTASSTASTATTTSIPPTLPFDSALTTPMTTSTMPFLTTPTDSVLSNPFAMSTPMMTSTSTATTIPSSAMATTALTASPPTCSSTIACAPSSSYHLDLGHIPVKCRVEKQIKLRLTLRDHAHKPVDSWQYIRLPQALVIGTQNSRRKKRSQQAVGRVLSLHVRVLCANEASASPSSSSPTSLAATSPNHMITSTAPQARRCKRCDARESRAEKRKVAKRRRTTSSGDDQDTTSKTTKTKVKREYHDASPEALNDVKGDDDTDLDHILVYHTGQSLIDFRGGQAVIAARITCYCRHNNAPNGFRLELSLVDETTKGIVAQALSTPIMVKDDHKQRSSSQSTTRSTTTTATTTTTTSVSPASSATRSSARLRGASASTRYGVPRPTLHTCTPEEVACMAPAAAAAAAAGNAVSSPSPVVKAEVPTIVKVIPASGPCSGGTEATLLGTGFRPELMVYFGGSPALRSECWGDATIVCTVPPSAEAGTFPVFFMDQRQDQLRGVPPSSHIASYTYEDQSDRELLELALLVIGQRMNGIVGNAQHIARSIVDSAGASPSPSQTSPNTFGSGPQRQQQLQPQSLSLSNNDDATAAPTTTTTPLTPQQRRRRVLDISLRALQALQSFDSPHPMALQLTNARGFTLLHYAAICNSGALAEWLLQTHTDPNGLQWCEDDMGMCALHHAAMLGHTDVVRALVHHAASTPPIDHPCERGWTPLQYAAYVADHEGLVREMDDVLQELIRCGSSGVSSDEGVGSHTVPPCAVVEDDLSDAIDDEVEEHKGNDSGSVDALPMDEPPQQHATSATPSAQEHDTAAAVQCQRHHSDAYAQSPEAAEPQEEEQDGAGDGCDAHVVEDGHESGDMSDFVMMEVSSGDDGDGCVMHDMKGAHSQDPSRASAASTVAQLWTRVKSGVSSLSPKQALWPNAHESGGDAEAGGNVQQQQPQQKPQPQQPVQSWFWPSDTKKKWNKSSDGFALPAKSASSSALLPTSVSPARRESRPWWLLPLLLIGVIVCTSVFVMIPILTGTASAIPSVTSKGQSLGATAPPDISSLSNALGFGGGPRHQSAARWRNMKARAATVDDTPFANAPVDGMTRERMTEEILSRDVRRRALRRDVGMGMDMDVDADDEEEMAAMEMQPREALPVAVKPISVAQPPSGGEHGMPMWLSLICAIAAVPLGVITAMLFRLRKSAPLRYASATLCVTVLTVTIVGSVAT